MQSIIMRQKKRVRTSRVFFVLICTIPVMLVYIILKLVPLFMMFVQSFQDLKSPLQDNKVWVGFQNYISVFRDTSFRNSLLLTLFYVIVATAITIFLALLLATALAKSKARGKTFFRIVFYIPNILSIVIIGGIFQALFKGTGIINAIFGGKMEWFVSNTWSKWCIIVAMVWQAVGYYMVMYIAGMDAIPDSLYESARLDGAKPMRQFFQITIPMLWEVIRTTLTFFIISNINLAFLFVVIMIGSDSMSAGDTTLNYMQVKAGIPEYSIAMTAGTIIFMLTFFVSLLVQKVTKREVIEAQ